MLRLNWLEHIMRCPVFCSRERQGSFLLYTSAILILSILISSTLVGCGGPSGGGAVSQRG